MECYELGGACRCYGDAPPDRFIFAGAVGQALEELLNPPTPLVYLALVRIIAVGTQLVVMLLPRGYKLRYFGELAALPDSMYEPLPALQLFLFPFGLDARPSFQLLTIIYWVTAVAGASALLGLKSRLSLLVFAAGSTFLQAFKYSFGDLHHREALMIVTLWLLVLAPAGRVLSLDGYFATRNSPFGRRLQKKSIFAAWPLLLIQNLLGLVYLDAALRKPVRRRPRLGERLHVTVLRL